MKVLDIQNNVVELPWDALCFLLDAYRDLRGSWNGSRSTDNQRQWTIEKSADAVKLILEADIHAISKYNEVKGKAETELSMYLRFQQNVTESLRLATEAQNQEAIDEFTRELADVTQRIADAQAIVDCVDVPSTDRTVYVFPALVTDLKDDSDFTPQSVTDQEEKKGKEGK